MLSQKKVSDVWETFLLLFGFASLRQETDNKIRE